MFQAARATVAPMPDLQYAAARAFQHNLLIQH
jgi:hypothetical protein